MTKQNKDQRKKTKQENQRKILHFIRLVKYFQTRSKVNVPVVRQEVFVKHPNIKKEFFKKPFKIKLQKFPIFSYPQKLQVQITKAKQNKLNQKQQKIVQIDYQLDDQTLYLQIPTKQFLQKVKQDYFLKSSYEISIPQMKLQKQNYQTPSFVKDYFNRVSTSLTTVNLWYYCGKRLTRWHYDGHDNFLFQKHGTKIIRLRSPNSSQIISDKLANTQNVQSKERYIRSNSIFNLNNNHLNQSEIVLEDKKKTNQITVILRKNQCLFIPRGWFHQVHSKPDNRRRNIAINFWGNTIDIKKQLNDTQMEIYFKQMVFEMTEKLCKKSIQDWEDLNQQLKTKFRKAYFCKYLSILDRQ